MNLIESFIKSGVIPPGISARDKSALLDAAANEIKKQTMLFTNCSTSDAIEAEGKKILDAFAKSREQENRIAAKKSPAKTAQAKAPAKPAPKPTALQAAWNKGLAMVKPAHQTAYSTFAKLQQIDPIKASIFLNVNRSAIVASKPAGITIQS